MNDNRLTTDQLALVAHAVDKVLSDYGFLKYFPDNP